MLEYISAPEAAKKWGISERRVQKLCEENDFEIVVFHSLRHLSTGYKLKMTNGDVKSVQGDTGHAEAEMVTDVYSEIIDEDRRFNAQKMDKEFYSNLNDEEEKSETETSVSDSDMMLLELLKSLSPEMKEQLLKQTLQNQSNASRSYNDTFEESAYTQSPV